MLVRTSMALAWAICFGTDLIDTVHVCKIIDDWCAWRLRILPLLDVTG